MESKGMKILDNTEYFTEAKRAKDEMQGAQFPIYCFLYFTHCLIKVPLQETQQALWGDYLKHHDQVK